MVNITSPDRFAAAVLDALNREIERVAEEEIEAAHKRIAERVRDRLGSIATAIFPHYDLTMDSKELLIRVRNEAKDLQP